MRPAVFLDRDGVLNADLGYVWRTADLRLMPGVPEALAAIRRADWLSIVVTNQSGIGRGFYTEADMHAFHDALQAAVTEAARFADIGDARIDAFYHCPFVADAAEPRWHHPDHPDRKPNPGMILRASRDWQIDPGRSFLVGDRQTDVEAALRAGIEGFLLGDSRLDTLVTRELGRRGASL